MVSDLSMFLTIVTVFVVIGGAMPSIYAGLEVNAGSEINVEHYVDEMGENMPEEITLTGSVVTGRAVITSIISMFFWNWAYMPPWLNILFMIPRIMLAILIIRMLRGQ